MKCPKFGTQSCAHKWKTCFVDIGSSCYLTCAHVLCELLIELGKEIKCEACRAFYHFSQRIYSIEDTPMLDSTKRLFFLAWKCYFFVIFTRRCYGLHYRDCHLIISISYPISTRVIHVCQRARKLLHLSIVHIIYENCHTCIIIYSSYIYFFSEKLTLFIHMYTCCLSSKLFISNVASNQTSNLHTFYVCTFFYSTDSSSKHTEGCTTFLRDIHDSTRNASDDRVLRMWCWAIESYIIHQGPQ